MLKGNTLIDSYVFKDEDLSASGFPNQNLIVGWVLRTVAIPNINPHQIMKTTQALAKQAIIKSEEKKVIAPISEAKIVELEKVLESKMKRLPAKKKLKTYQLKKMEEKRELEELLKDADEKQEELDKIRKEERAAKVILVESLRGRKETIPRRTKGMNAPM